MIAIIPTIVLLAAAVGVAIVLVLRRRFTNHLADLEAQLREAGAAQGGRSDLPAEVVALAARMGARADGAPDFTAFEQSGQMWQTPGGKPQDFTARQTIRVGAPGFLWRAKMGPVLVADYFVGATGGLEAMLLGAFPLARTIGGATANQGEILRYLAELPWCPDAILVNGSLDWTVIDTKTIKVGTGAGAARGEVTFELDDDGLIARASAPSRVYAEPNGRTSAHPWRGRFWDYQRIGDQFMPMQGEVAWGLASGDFVYWRGRILGRRASASSAA
jgi:hypothetical protein